MPLYTISYDLRTIENPTLTNEEFRRLFIKLLLENSSNKIKSYNNSTILFQLDLGFDEALRIVDREIHNYVFYQFSEIPIKEGAKYKCNYIANPEHINNFNNLVNEVKETMED